jgi:hypothetical protein
LKVLANFILFILAAVAFSESATAQMPRAQNQVLQAYVLQGKTVPHIEKELTGKANVLVNAAKELLDLNEQQVATLKLACSGDISRIIQDIAELELHTKDIDLQKMGNNQEEMQKIWPMVMPARQRIELGLHKKDSLFLKAFDSVLSKEQQEKYQQHEQKKTARKVLAITKMTLVEMEGKLPLTQKQRNKIVELVEKNPLPKSIDDNTSYYIGLTILSRLPKEQLSEILTEDQVKIFQQMTRNGAQFGGMGGVVW